MTAYLVLSSQLGAGLLLLFTLLLQGFHLSLQLLFLLLKDSHVFEELIFLSLCFFHLLLIETQKKHTVFTLFTDFVLAKNSLATVPYLKEAGFGGDYKDVRVAFVLHRQQLVLCGAAGAEQERRACATDLTFVGHVTKLVELAVVVWHIVS